MPKAAYAVLVVLMLIATGASVADLLLKRQDQANLAARLKDVEDRLKLMEKESKEAWDMADMYSRLSVQRENQLVTNLGRLRMDIDELRKGAIRDDPDSLVGLRKQLEELRKLIEKKK